MALKFHHIAIATDNSETTSSIFNKIGFIQNGSFIDKMQDVKIQFVNNEDLRIELVEPNSENSPVKNILKKIGVSPYHLCFSSDSFEQDITFLKDLGFINLTDEKPAIAFNYKNIIFLYHKNFGLIELIDEK